MAGKDIVIALVASFTAGLLVWFLQDQAKKDESAPPAAAYTPLAEEEE